MAKGDRLITQGFGTLGQIYDRLRKRSLRRLNRDSSKNAWAGLLGMAAHASYVRGVREALQAVEQSGDITCSSCGWRL